MRQMIVRVFCSFVLLGSCCAAARAANFCVSTNSELTLALFEASSNGEDDLIAIVGEGRLYTGAIGGFAFQYATQQNFDVVIEGGYAETPANCSNRVTGTFSIIDGGGLKQGLLIDARGTGSITIRSMKFQDGVSTRNGAGLSISGTSFRGDVTVQESFFEYNESQGSGGGLYVQTEGDVKVFDSVFIGNVATVDAGAARIAARRQLAGLRNLVAHNTVVENGCAVGAPASCDVGGFQFSADSTSALYNNLFHGNEGVALHLQGEPGILAHNNVGTVVGATPASSYGNVAVADPRFVDLAANPPNVALQEDSPLIDRGTDDFPASSHTSYGSAPDIGRAEHRGLRFRDGFE